MLLCSIVYFLFAFHVNWLQFLGVLLMQARNSAVGIINATHCQRYCLAAAAAFDHRFVSHKLKFIDSSIPLLAE